MNIIVTGAAGALGEAVADRLCEVGSRVALVDLIEGKQRPHSTWTRAADLADPDEASKAIAGALQNGSAALMLLSILWVASNGSWSATLR